jgi:predicted component of type VI protein secretion system
LREGRNKLGRDGGCDIVVQDARASGDHAYLFVGDDGSASLTDVSRNGTLVDGNPIQGGTARLDHGSVVQIGAVRLTVLLTPP